MIKNELRYPQTKTHITTDPRTTPALSTFRFGHRRKRGTNLMHSLSETYFKRHSTYWILFEDLDRQRMQVRGHRERMFSNHLGSFIISTIPGRKTLHVTQRKRPLELALWRTRYRKSCTLDNKTPRVLLQHRIPKMTEERCRQCEVEN